MTLASDLQVTAETLITEFGELVSFDRFEQSDYDPETGESVTETGTTYSGYVVPTDYKLYEIDGTNILRGDKKLLCHKMSQVPCVGDFATISGTEYRVVSVMPTRLSGNDVIYSLQVRR